MKFYLPAHSARLYSNKYSLTSQF